MMKKWMSALVVCLCLLLCVGAAMAENEPVTTNKVAFTDNSGASYTLEYPLFADVPYGYDNEALKGTLQFRDSNNNPVVNYDMLIQYAFKNQEWDRTETTRTYYGSSAISDWEIQLKSGLLPGEYAFGVTVKLTGAANAEPLLEKQITINVLHPLYRIVKGTAPYEVTQDLTVNRVYATVESIRTKFQLGSRQCGN